LHDRVLRARLEAQNPAGKDMGLCRGVDRQERFSGEKRPALPGAAYAESRIGEFAEIRCPGQGSRIEGRYDE
jgi:hypothetical protein